MAENPFAPPRAHAVSEAPEAPEVSGFEVSIVCPSCGANVRIGEEACSGCRRPVTREEKQALQRRWEASDRDVAKASEATYWGRVSIAVAAVLATLQAVFLLTVPTLGLGAMGVAVVLWGLFAWSFKKPLAACVSALVVYVSWWVGQLLFATLLGLDGLLFRMLILSALMAGVGAEWNLRRRRLALVRARQANAK